MSKTVMIVEDEADLAGLISDVLAADGYQVVLATGRSAVQHAEQTAPSLVLIDYVMPGLSGADVIAQMRARFGPSLPPLVLLSARSEVQELAREVGADGYLYKPFDVEELLSLVSRLTGQETQH